MAEPRCPKCNSPMEEGFFVDHTYGGVNAPEWAEGKPERSIWTGVKMRGREKLPITTYRCERCGFLESYANRKPE
jgi:hypothetical protein